MAETEVSGVAVSATTPTGNLIGYIPSQFGYIDYYQTNGNFEKNSYGYLTFRFALGITIASGGNFIIATDSLDLENYV
jgi:hypothetical protein